MSETYAIVTALKQSLRSRGITYKQVGRLLGLTESSVKRLFAERDFSLQRLERICQIMDMRLGDLLALAESQKPFIRQLTREQEALLVSDIKLLLVAVCVTNCWTFREILEHYSLSETETIRALAKLDRLKLIELLPNNRVKLLMSPDFSWIDNGPIEQFFEGHVQSDFFNSRFDGPRETRLFIYGMLSHHSTDLLLRQIERLAVEFRQLHNEDVQFPLAERNGTSLVVAMRSWEMAAFDQLRKDKQSVEIGTDQ